MFFRSTPLSRRLRLGALRCFATGDRGCLDARRNQVDGVHPQDCRELAQDKQRRVANRALNLADVRPVYFSVERESLLRQALLASQ